MENNLDNYQQKKFWFLVVGAIVAFSYIWALTFGTIPEDNREMASTILGVVLGVCIKDAYSYLYGSTQSSQAKDNLISKAMDTIPPPSSQNNISTLTLNWLGSFDAAPGNPAINDAYINTTQNKNFYWDGNVWNVTTQNPA